MKIATETFRIGDVAKKLNVERFVIRFWEREFGIKSHRSAGGQRFYSEKDMKQILLIKELLYDNGLTIAGAKKYLQQNGVKSPKTSNKKIEITAATLDIDASAELTQREQSQQLSAAEEPARHNQQSREALLNIKEQAADLKTLLLKLEARLSEK